ncbi:MAG TPA: alpha/beta hydrolase [Longimicrobiaceae bacterium]|nr:alpha/beta hydrolase [Longimicrobiaceae bacterium]
MTAGEAPPAARSDPFPSADGIPLHHLSWPVAAPRAGLLVVHGLGEHAGRYAALARDLAPRGVAVHAFDLRGHGRSGGPRAHAPSFDALVHDLDRFRAEAAARLPAGLPLFLLGHSLGGLVALRWLQSEPAPALRGAVLSAPLLGVKLRAPRWKVAAAGVLSRWLPALPLASGIDPDTLTHDAAYVRSYREDPLVHARVTPRLYTEFMAAIPRALAEPERVRLPVLVLVPGADAIVDAEAVRAFARRLAGDVTVREYPGFYHESLNEVDRHRVVIDLLEWMEARLG